MSIGTYKSLVEAANGKIPPRMIPTANDPAPGQDVYDARARREALAASVAGKTASAVANSVAAGQPGLLPQTTLSPSAATSPTKTYATILSGVTRPTQGLSSEGKYGGFYSQGAMESAIKGTVGRLTTDTVAGLRAAADQRYAELDKLYAGQYGKGLASMNMGDISGNIKNRYGTTKPANPRMFEEATKEMTVPLRDYAKKLGSWYNQNTVPAEEFLTTAQQIEATPASRLAQQIAVSAYGQNPDWAAGAFSGLDAELWKDRRNAESIAAYGKSYDEIEALKKEASDLYGPKALANQATTSLETAIGIPAKTLQTASGRTIAELNAAINIPSIKYKNGDGQEVVGPVADVINDARYYANKGDFTKAAEVASSVSEYEDNQSSRLVADLIYAILKTMSSARYNARDAMDRLDSLG